MDSLVHTLDDLENLWDVPGPDRARFARAIGPLLDHPEPMVRASAAACLGRLGQDESAAALIGRLDDPSKIVWRSGRLGLAATGQPGPRHRLDRRRPQGPEPEDPPRGRPDLRLSVPRHGYTGSTCPSR